MNYVTNSQNCATIILLLILNFNHCRESLTQIIMPFPRGDSIPKSLMKFLQKNARKGMDRQVKDTSEEQRTWRTPTKWQVEQLMIKMNWKKNTVN
jgi:hypothetical protein